MLTNIIPAPWRILFIVLAMAAAAALGWQEGAMHTCEVDVRLKEGKVVVSHDPARTSTDALIAALDKAGYGSQPSAAA